MRWYLFVLMMSFVAITFVRADTNMVPSLDLDCERDFMHDDDMDALFAHTSVTKVPRWKSALQQWGVSLFTYVMWLKEYSLQQYEKLKIRVVALLYKKNDCAQEKV